MPAVPAELMDMMRTKLGQAPQQVQPNPQQAAQAAGAGAARQPQPNQVGPQTRRTGGGFGAGGAAMPAMPGPAGNVIVGAAKLGQLTLADPQPQPRREKPVDYARSLVTQYRPDERRQGQHGAATGGVLGAALGAVLVRLLTERPDLVGAGAALGGAGGALIGRRVGRADAATEYSRLLGMRRLGLNSPAELLAATRFPGTLDRVLSNPRL